ncbi:MAG: hypothetical protein Q4Q23_01620 [Methanobacteriaceae archaeon]|nr:hypothetical protein [Methanobacteriaceae archaeon]
MNQEQKHALVETVENTSPWERISTTEDGIFLIKTPENNGNVTVFVEINPSVKGQPLKKRGVFIKNKEEYEIIKELLSNHKIKELLETINEFYCKQEIPKIEI